MRLRRGFTLIELLVVIAIISILAAFLFPVFAGGRGSAREKVCLSNLRQIGTAARMYVQDYDETLIPQAYSRERGAPVPEYANTFYSTRYVSWAELLQPYIANLDVFTCPERPDVIRRGYCLNSNSSGEVFPGSPTPPGNGAPGSDSVHTADIVSESDTIWFYDSTPNVLFIIRWSPWKDLTDLAKRRPTTATAMNIVGSRMMAQILEDAGASAETSSVIKDPWRHNQGMNIAWCDGHASHVKPSTLKEQSWNIEQMPQPDE